MGGGVWVCILSVGFWVGDGRAGDSDAGSLWHLRRRHKHRRLSCRIPTHTLGDLPVSRASLGGGTSVLHQRSTAVRDGISARCRRGRMEPHKGTKALHNEPIDSRKSSARVKSARRIRRGKGRRIGKGLDIEAWMPHRVDGPSIAWGDREGARDPW